MLTTLASVFGEVMAMFGDVVTALFTTTGDTPGALSALLPYFLVGIACSLILLGAKVIRKFVWGN